MERICEIMADELETDSLNLEESIFEESMLAEYSKEIYLTTSCSAIEVHLSDTQDESTNEANNKDTVTSHLGKICSWDSLPSSLQAVFPNDTKYTYVMKPTKRKSLKHFRFTLSCL